MPRKRLHKCAADGCSEQTEKPFCFPHYQKLPSHLRQELAHNFHIGAGGAWLNNIRAGIKYLKGLEAVQRKANPQE